MLSTMSRKRKEVRMINFIKRNWVWFALAGVALALAAGISFKR